MHRARLALLGLALSLPAAAIAEDSDALTMALALEAAFVEAAENARDAVVTLTVSGSHIGGDIPEDPDDFEDFLRRERPEHRMFEGMGSGFIVDEQGTIYTNAHVVQGAQTIEVLFRDGRRGKADVIGADEASDVAVIRLLDPPDDLRPIELADSDQVKVGQFALAFGSPMLLAGSVTVGHVSALHRNEVGRMGPKPSANFDTLRYQDFLQVDTPINPGNSGGPLLDIRGRVIGINTAIYGGADGLGFSIPINMALGIGEQLVTAGTVRRGYLGVRMSEMDPDLVELYGLDLARPVVINGIEPGSPAEAGKFKEQDIVLEFGGRRILTKSDLVNAIASSPIGEAIEATVYRTDGDEGRMQLTVVLVEQSERPSREKRTARKGPSAAEERTLLNSHGLAFSEEGNKGVDGAVVSQVRSGSHADEAGLKPGDVILQIEDTETEDGSTAVAALRASKRPFVPLRYLRDGKNKVTSIERPR